MVAVRTWVSGRPLPTVAAAMATMEEMRAVIMELKKPIMDINTAMTQFRLTRMQRAMEATAAL